MTREEAIKRAINILVYVEAHIAKSKEAREDVVNIIEALEQELCIQEKQANADKVYIDGFKAGYSQAKFDLEQEPCEDAVSRKDVINILPRFRFRDMNTYLDARNELDKLPPVTPAEKAGQWIEHEHNGIAHIECSKCSSWFLRSHLMRNSYCPNCGARMEVEE